MDLLHWVRLASQAGVVVAVLGSLYAVYRLDSPGGAWGERLRSRLLGGVPWGTLVACALVLAVYLFVQDGWSRWYDPVTLPFYSWSYFYPLGWLAAPFAHSGASHLTGNLFATLALAPLAEYAWSHFPTERGASSFSSWRTNPYVRSFLLFPLGVVAVGYATVLFHWGPVIGFSGVVFAFAGFALVRFPVTTLVALLARQVVGTFYAAFREPVTSVTVSPSFSPPWWTGIAVEGHLFGLLAGVLLGAVVVSRREERPPALRLWAATLLLATSFSLWAVWYIGGADAYVLFRGPGVLMVSVLAVLVTVAVRSTDREFAAGLSRRYVATLLVVFPLLLMALVAVPVNATLVGDHALPGETVTVRDYSITYAEGVTNPKTRVFSLDFLGASPTVTTGGVIVASDERELWTQQLSPGFLAFTGTAYVRVGGLGWRETVLARRRGWSAVHGPTAYQVWLGDGHGDLKHVFTSDPARAGVTLAGKNVSVVPEAGEFYVSVSRRNETLGRAPVPGANETVTVSGVRFVRDGPHVLGVLDGGANGTAGETRVPVLRKETYE
ncbi:MAG: rhomboid family intramembrane serine protease [Halobacteriaceae archaeon]